MEASFWIDKWESNTIGFHQTEANKSLVDYFHTLSLKPGQNIFLPLCGKTLDIGWLIQRGCRVTGAELSQLAVEQLFEQLSLEPKITVAGNLKLYQAENIDVYLGDFFDLDPAMLNQVNAIYDRAALVALPEEMRVRYAQHLINLSNTAPQLLLTLEYDQSEMDGPPFSVVEDEVRRHYGETYSLKLLRSADVPGGLKGKCAAIEHIWLLQ